MTAVSFILKIFSSKITYILLFIATIVITSIVFKSFAYKYEKKIDVLENTIEDLEITNNYLYKENIMQHDKITLLTTYSNSTMIINKLNRNKLEEGQKHAINNVSNDFYDYFNIMSNN